MIDTVKSILIRDLQKLKTEIDSYRQEDALWKIEKNIANSGGNLCLHLIGNLNTYIGVVFAKTNYVRDRDLEFSARNVPKKELLNEIDNTIEVVAQGLDKVQSADLQNEFPIAIWDKPATIEYTLLHLLAHLNYHLGQINYHRRLIDQ